MLGSVRSVAQNFLRILLVAECQRGGAVGGDDAGKSRDLLQRSHRACVMSSYRMSAEHVTTMAAALISSMDAMSLRRSGCETRVIVARG